MDVDKLLKQRLTAYLRDAMRMLQKENVANDDAIGSRDTTNAVCNAIEAIFLHGLKGSATDKIWTLFKAFTSKGVCTQIDELKQIRTDVGRCRAWIRLAINDCALESYLHIILNDDSLLKSYYRQTAYLRDPEEPSIMLTCIQGLSNFVFNLACNSTVLNQWTTMPLVLAGLAPSTDAFPAPTNTALVVSPSKSASHVTAASRPGRQRAAVLIDPAPSSDHAHLQATSGGSSSCLQTSVSCPQHLNSIDFALSASLQLTQTEIETLRCSLLESNDDYCNSPRSDTSHPDFKDARHDIYNLVYGISPDSSGDALSDRMESDRLTDGGQLTDRLTDGGQSTDRLTDAERDMRFEQIVRANLDNYPLDYDQSRTERMKQLHFDRFETRTSEGHFNGAYQHRNTEVEVTRSNETPAAVSMVPDTSSVTSVEQDASCVSNVAKQQDTSCVSNVTEQQDSSCVSENGETVAQLRDPTTDEYSAARKREESFRSLLKNYKPVAPPRKVLTLEEVINTLPDSEDQTTPLSDTQSKSSTSSSSVNMSTESSDVMSSNDIIPQVVSEMRASDPLQFLFSIRLEKGIQQQCYQCHGCKRAIGMFYGKERLCDYNGFYYCYECHENDLHCIPARIIYSWDFRPYRVCKKSMEYLLAIRDAPLFDIIKLNPSLYDHVKLLGDIRTCRIQLRFLKSYVYSCKQPTADEFVAKFNGKTYLFDHVDLYSLHDLQHVSTRVLCRRLDKIITSSTSHVYNCTLCSQKGFYCEICRHSKVIFPFETNTTTRCESCKSVYHSHCKTKLVPCPKCERRRLRNNNMKTVSDSIDPVNYTFPETA